MHSLCMDAAGDENVQPIKILLVAALPIPIMIEMKACLLSPEHLIWARGEHGGCPKGARTNWVGRFVGTYSQLRQSTPFRMTVLCTPKKPRL